jgi:hypothetical protein
MDDFKENSDKGDGTILSPSSPVPPREDDPYALANPYDDSKPRVRATSRLRSALVVMACTLILAVLGGAGWLAWDTLRPPDYRAYASDGISVAGLGDEDFIVTPEQLAALDCERTSATGTGGGQAGESKAGSVDAYGPLMETLLGTWGYSLADFKRIKVYCKDGYSVILRPELLEGDPVLSVADGADPLEPYQRPLRMVIPGEVTGKWAFGVMRIEFVR